MFCRFNIFWGMEVISMTRLPLFDLSRAELWTDPHPQIRSARTLSRTGVSNTGEVVLLHSDDIDELHTSKHFRMPGLEDLERGGVMDGPFYEWRRRTLPVLDGEQHMKLRGFVSASFSPRQMDRLRIIASERAHELIDACTESGEMDVLGGFADDLPLWSMCRFIGIDEGDRQKILGFLVGTEDMFSFPLTAEKRRQGETSIVALHEYVADLIAKRTLEPGDDVISRLVVTQNESDFPDIDTFIALLVNVIGGAVGSTRSALSNAILEFARNPEQTAQLRKQPDLIPRAVEECLRFHPPFRIGRRVVRSAVRAFDLDLAAGQTILVLRAAYNRDPARFERPDEFDIFRPENRNLSFGFGPHMCLGRAIAKVNLQEGLKVFHERCDDLAVIGSPQRIPFTVDEKLDGLRLRMSVQPQR
jgi:cytochrome P450